MAAAAMAAAGVAAAAAGAAPPPAPGAALPLAAAPAAVGAGIMKPDLIFLLDECGVPDAVRARLLEDGVITMPRLHIMAETRADLRQLITVTWGLDQATAANRLGTVALIDAWECARVRVEEERRLTAASRAAGEAPALPRSAHLSLRAAVADRFDGEVPDAVAPHDSLVDAVLNMVEENHVEPLRLSEVFSKKDKGQEAGNLSIDAKGNVKLKRRRIERSAPEDAEALRARLRVWGLAFTYARARHPQREWLADAVPSCTLKYIDHLLGDSVSGFAVPGCGRPPMHIILDYDWDVRSKQAKLINEGQSFGRALDAAAKDSEIRETSFVTPLVLHVASTAGSGSRGPKAQGSGNGNGNGGTGNKGNGKNKPNAKAKAKGKGDGKGRNNSQRSGKGGGKIHEHTRTPDGKEICFHYQRNDCSGCKRAHICTGCLGNHSFADCPSR